MWELKEWNEIFDGYLNDKYPELNRDSEPFKNYRESVEYIFEHSNFILFPLRMKTNKSKDDTKDRRIYQCQLIVNDMCYWQWIIERKITFDYSILQTFDTLRQFLEKQCDYIKITIGKSEKEAFREHFRLWLLAWFKAIFWLDVDIYVDHIGFEPEDDNHFTFTNGTLDIETQEFTPWTNILQQNPSVKITFPSEQVDELNLEQCLKSMYSLKQYVSESNSISSIFVGYLISWIFREDYKAIHNEYPFLWIQSGSGAGKTSILNFISWISGYDTGSVEWTWNTSYASLAGMNYTWKWFYFFDEFQQLTNGQQKLIQSAYNSWRSYKWGMGDCWRSMWGFDKDCNLICSGENITTDNEALLNRFIILDEKDPFLIVMNVRNREEFEKYETLTGEKVKEDYLNTDEIKCLARDYYRPRFMTILKHKKDIDYREYHDQAVTFIKEVVSSIDKDNRPGLRIQNNLIPAITWYLMICWDNIDVDEIHSIIEDYFSNYMEFRKNVYVSWRAVNYIINHIGEFCSLLWKVKWITSNFPMVYLKYTKKKKWLIMQISTISQYIAEKLKLSIDGTIIEPQLRWFLWIPTIPSSGHSVAKSKSSNIGWVFIPFTIIESVEPLKKIRDATLDFIGTHYKDLQEIKEQERFSIGADTLQWFIDEMEEAYQNAEFFDTETFSWEIPEEEKAF